MAKTSGRIRTHLGHRFPETCTMRTGITVVRRRSLSLFQIISALWYFFTNDMIDEALVKKRGQIFLTTRMVAVLIKKVGKETINEDKTFAANFDKWYKRLDYFCVFLSGMHRHVRRSIFARPKKSF